MQLTLDLEPGLLQRYRTLRAALSASVYRYHGGMGAVASGCDMSPSELSRQLNLNDHDHRKLDVDDLDQILTVTGDLLPLQWLIAKHLSDDEARRRAALAELESLVTRLHSLIQGGE